MHKSVVSGSEEGRGEAQERRGEYPSGGLHVRARHEIAEIVNGEEISAPNPLIHQYVSGIVPTETAAIHRNGTKRGYHIGVCRDCQRTERRQAQKGYLSHSFKIFAPIIAGWDSQCQRVFREAKMGLDVRR